MSSCIPVCTRLLGSKVITDVLESLEFLTTAVEFQVKTTVINTCSILCGRCDIRRPLFNHCGILLVGVLWYRDRWTVVFSMVGVVLVFCGRCGILCGRRGNCILW